MNELPEDLRTALLLQVMGRLSSSQIGEALEVPAGTVRYRIAMARKRLAELLRLDEHLGTKGRT
jgi:RNA polymerase sigma-70 factor, ECF subfamily